ncbi:hypothetical protein Tco_1052676 [Tanacetum coccineum]
MVLFKDVKPFWCAFQIRNLGREQLSDASIEIKAYSQGLKKVEAQLVTHWKRIFKKRNKKKAKKKQNQARNEKDKILSRSANPLGRSASVGRSGVGRSGVGRSATGVGWSGVGRSGVGRSATGVGTNATGLGRSGSGVGRSESGMGVNATGLGGSATLIDDEGVNESTNKHDDGIDVRGSTIVFVGPASGVGGSVQGTGGSGIGRGVVRGCDIPRLKWSPF